MHIYESLLEQWGQEAGIAIKIGSKQVCKVQFIDNVSIQIDLHPTGEFLVVSSILSNLDPGSYRDLIFKTALHVNGSSITPRGILSFSEKMGALILFEFVAIAHTDPQKLNALVTLFHAHAKVWIDALQQQALPTIIEENSPTTSSKMFGLS